MRTDKPGNAGDQFGTWFSFKALTLDCSPDCAVRSLADSDIQE